MPLNYHLQEFNNAKHEAEMSGDTEFIFRGKAYHKGSWSNGTPVWYGDETFRGRKKRSNRKKRSRRSKGSKGRRRSRR